MSYSLLGWCLLKRFCLSPPLHCRIIPLSHHSAFASSSSSSQPKFPPPNAAQLGRAFQRLSASVADGAIRLSNFEPVRRMSVYGSPCPAPPRPAPTMWYLLWRRATFLQVVRKEKCENPLVQQAFPPCCCFFRLLGVSTIRLFLNLRRTFFSRERRVSHHLAPAPILRRP